VLDERQPDVFGEEAPVFATRSGGPLDDHNVRRRVFSPLVGDAFDPPRALTPHCGLGAELVIFMPVLYWLRRRPSS
jgi:prepilin signal peptidase PulO-like enzyme (type II secretory pathway)